MNWKKNVLFIILTLWCINQYSQEFQFENLTITEGFSDNSVRDIMQDSKGYLWFATLNGLDRFDGKVFKNYTAVPGDSSSLRNSRIQQVKEDLNGYIWVNSLNGDVHRIDPASNKVLNLNEQVIKRDMAFMSYMISTKGDVWLWGPNGCARVRYTDDQGNFETILLHEDYDLPQRAVNFVFEDQEGTIWLGMQKGIVRISEGKSSLIKSYLEEESFISFLESPDIIWLGTEHHGLVSFDKRSKKLLSLQDRFPRIDEPILCIEAIDSSRLLLGGGKHVFEVNTRNEEMIPVSHRNLEGVSKIFLDVHGNVWVIPQSRGIYRYIPQSHRLVYYDLNASERKFLGDFDKQILFEDSNQRLWVGISHGGLFLYQPESDSFRSVRYETGNSIGFSSSIVLSIFEDNSKNLWIGTMYGGVNKLDLSIKPFVWHKPVKHPLSIFDNEIRAAVVDRLGNLWLGSKGGQLFCYDSSFQLVRVLPDELSAKNKTLLRNTNVYCLYFDKEDNLWIGTKGKGVFIIRNLLEDSSGENEILHFDKDYDPPNTQALDAIYAIVQDKYGRFWIGSHSLGLCMLSDPFGEPAFTSFTPTNTSHKLISNHIRHLMIDDENNLWIATSNGISLLPEDKLLLPENHFIPITNDKKQLSSLSYNSVDYMFQASDKTIYAGTMGGGINQLIEMDLDKEIIRWRYFNQAHGLSTNTVYAIQEDENHNLWISTSLGINQFDPETETIENFFLEKGNGSNHFTESCGARMGSGEIVFGNSHGFMRFDPSSIQKDSTEYPLILSRFFVNGTEIVPKSSVLLEQSIEYTDKITLDHTQNSLRIDFSVLDFRSPQKIQFSYKLENHDKDWSTPLTANSAVYQNLRPGDYLFRVKATNSYGVEMNNTRELRIIILPPFFQSLWGRITIFLTGFTILIVFFYLYNQQIATRHKMHYQEKLNKKKLEYYTNISHELKTPLTMILNPVEDIIEDEEASEKIISSAHYIKKNAAYLLNLVEQILDFRKIREEKMVLNVSPIQLSDFFNEVYHVFHSLADKQDIDFLLRLPEQPINGWLDRDIVEKILYNLLSNAFKNTPAHKTIELRIKLSDNGILTIEVKDTGVGMSEKKLTQLFKRFYRSGNSSGLGLFFVKELVEIHKGQIEVESALGKGTNFVVRLPVDETHYEEHEKIHTQVQPKLATPTILSSLEIPAETNRKTEQKECILIIDDHEEMLEYLTKKLKNNYKIYTANNGKKGVELAIEKRPDIILCDLMMPVMDGAKATEELRKNFNTSHIPIILLTANSNPEKKYEGMELGADDYITKPFEYKYLKLRIDNLIQQRKQLRRNFSQTPELPADSLTKSDQDKKFIERVTQYINQYMGEPDFSVESLSKELGLSRTKFYQKMKGITGETPHEFIRTMQMKKAALFLRETHQSIGDIGSQVGFNDTNYFSKSFKKHFGTSPKSYQLKHRAESM